MTRNILVIDGNSIMNRAFYGIRPLTNKDGLQTNAVYGTVNIILKHLENLKPDFGVVAFDLKAPTFRHKMYTEYKAGRHAMPEELAVQIPYVKRVCELLGFKVLSLEGYEADDIIGTIAQYACKEKDLFSYVLTGDRDSLQLISDDVNVLLAGNNETVWYDKQAFTAKYGVTPDTFVDVKALMGDASDNIPGVAGVGEKTALKLISEFGSLDGIYENINSDSIAKGVRAKLENDRDRAYLSQKLAQIDCNVPLGIDLDSIEYKGFNSKELLKLFTELEFGALIKRLGLDSVDDNGSPHASAAEFSNLPTTLENMIKSVNRSQCAAFTLTAKGELTDIALSTDGSVNLTCSVPVDKCEAFLNEHSKKFIVYDSKMIFNSTGIDPMTKFMFDIKLGAYVADSSVGKYELERLSLKYLGESYSGDADNAAIIYKLYA
ncbi:MAG: DNA polymerase I, partial [Clostridia bacterium]|nr:DNA polymerase I [Clostridia bacterium]